MNNLIKKKFLRSQLKKMKQKIQKVIFFQYKRKVYVVKSLKCVSQVGLFYIIKTLKCHLLICYVLISLHKQEFCWMFFISLR